MDYKIFRSRYDFVYLSGLKGEERICEIQDKNTSRIYDYAELIEKNDDIDLQRKFCENMKKNLKHPNLLKLREYSYVFIEETHGNPYCKFFLVFEYSESSLDREMCTLNLKGELMKENELLNLMESLLSAIKFLHKKGIHHGNLIPKRISLNEKKEFKLILLKSHNKKIKPKPKALGISSLPYIDKYSKDQKNNLKLINKIHGNKVNKLPKKEISIEEIGKKKNKSKIQKEQNNSLTNITHFLSPEEFNYQNNRIAYEKYDIKVFPAEIFSLGMLLLSAATLDDLSSVYSRFSINFQRIKELISIVETRQFFILLLI